MLSFIGIVRVDDQVVHCRLTSYCFMKLAFLLISLAIGLHVSGQPPRNPVPFVQTGDSLTTRLMSGHEDEFPLFNGRQHYGYAITIEGTPYFGGAGWQAGSVKYDDAWYHGLQVMYDTHADLLVVQHPNGMAITLLTERVQEFQVGGKTFVHLREDMGQNIKPGYYQRLVEGPLTVLARRITKLDEKINGLQVEQKFRASDHYFTLKDGQLRTLRREKDIMQLVKDERSDIAQELRSKGIRYKQSPEPAMIMIATLFNQSNGNR